MPTTGCGIRALWIVNSYDAVVFSRRFPVVEKQWRAACKSENKRNGGRVDSAAFSCLPSDSELASSFAERKKREGSVRGFGIRVSQSAEGSDSWVDDPVTSHVISIYINKEEARENYLLWPLILHMKSQFCILVLPLVELGHLNSYRNYVKDLIVAMLLKERMEVYLCSCLIFHQSQGMVSFRIAGASLCGISIAPKSVSIYPAVKAPVEFSIQARTISVEAE